MVERRILPAGAADGATAQHHRSRLDGRAVVVAEAETATGQLSEPVLDAIADVASYVPLTWPAGWASRPR